MEAIISIALLVAVLSLNVTSRSEQAINSDERESHLRNQTEASTGDVSVCDRAEVRIVERDLSVPKPTSEAADHE